MLKSSLYTNKIINPYLLKSIWPIIKAIFKEPFNRRINGNDFFTGYAFNVDQANLRYSS